MQYSRDHFNSTFLVDPDISGVQLLVVEGIFFYLDAPKFPSTSGNGRNFVRLPVATVTAKRKQTKKKKAVGSGENE